MSKESKKKINEHMVYDWLISNKEYILTGTLQMTLITE